jgi:hypothetical protein
MAKITIPDIASQFASQEALNARFTQVEDELNNKVLYRTETNGEPNEMLAELDMNTNKLINLGEPVNPNDAARLQDLQTVTLEPGTIIPTQTESVTLTAGQRTVDFVSFTTTGSSFNISGPDTDDARLVLGRDFTVPTDSSILLAQSYPAGSLIQLLRNVVGGEQVADVSYSQSESITLADSQTTVVFNLYSTEYAGFYISGTDTDSGRLATSDFSIVSNSSIELAQSYPEGTTVTLLRNSTEGNAGGVTKIIAGTNVTISPEAGFGDVTINASVTAEQAAVLEHLSYDPDTRIIVADRAIETTLNSLYLGEQHKMSSGAENIFFTNLTSATNFYPMWGGLKDQSLTANQGPEGFIPPSGRVYTNLVSQKLGGDPLPVSSIGYSGPNYFGVNIAGLGITTVSAEDINYTTTRLEYRLSVNGKQVYMQELDFDAHVHAGDQIEWFFDHPVEIHAGTTIFAEIIKVDKDTDADLGIFQVRVGDDGTGRYQATVHNRLFEDKDLELISPYLKYQSMDFGLDPTGSSIMFRDLSLDEPMLAPHPVNSLKAVGLVDSIQVTVKDGAKILVESLPVAGASIDGTTVNADVATAVNQLNSLFTNTSGFSAGGVVGLAPTLSDYTLQVTEGDSINHATAIAAASDLVTMYGFENLPGWLVGNQSTGVVLGTTPAYDGSTPSNNTYTYTVKAGNPFGMSSATVTVTVLESVWQDTRSVAFSNQDYLGANAALLDGALGRSGSGSGTSDEWTISFWIKPSSPGSGRVILYYGSNDTTNGGHLEVRLSSQNRLRVSYGSDNNHIRKTTSTAFTTGAWQHVCLTYNGGTTGASSGSLSDYYSRFSIFVDGSAVSTSNAHSNYGWSGSVSGQNFRVGKLVSGNYLNGDKLNEIAIWSSDQSGAIADIYSTGATADLSDLSTAPTHWWRMGDDDTYPTIQDNVGTAHFVMYNMTAADIVNDTP